MLFKKGLAHDIRTLFGLCQGVGIQMEQIAYKTNPHCQYPDVLRSDEARIRLKAS